MKAAFFLRLFELLTWLLLDIMGRWHQRRRAGGSIPPVQPVQLSNIVLSADENNLTVAWSWGGSPTQTGTVKFYELDGGNWVAIETHNSLDLEVELDGMTNPGGGTYKVGITVPGQDEMFSNQVMW